MTDSRVDSSLIVPGADGRRVLNGQLQRRQWEAAWIDQHQNAFDVIEYGQRTNHGSQSNDTGHRSGIPGEPVGALSARNGQAALLREARDTQIAGRRNAYDAGDTSRHTRASSAHVGSAGREPADDSCDSRLALGASANGGTDKCGSSSEGATLAVSSAASTGARAAIAVNVAYPAGSGAHLTSAQQVQPLSPEPTCIPQSAALWRDGDNVRGAMRLNDPTRAAETVATLREWLRDAGLWLREVWVNGKIAFKSGRDHGN